MPFIPNEFFQVVCADKRTAIFMTSIMVLTLGLMGCSVYLVVRPIECIDQQKVVYVNKMFETKVNCREIPIAHFPRAVAIIEKGTNLHVCSGVVISDRSVLTAARCLEPCKDTGCINYTIRTKSSYSNRGGKLLNITDIVIHPLFNVSTIENDLALMKTDHISGVDEIEFTTSYSGELYGWTPFSKADTPYRDNMLKLVVFDIVPNDLCNIYLKGDYTNFKLRENMICATLISKEAGCYIDPGSPIVSQNRLIGIAMFGKLCYSCRSNVAAFTNINAYKKFIRQLF